MEKIWSMVAIAALLAIAPACGSDDGDDKDPIGHAGSGGGGGNGGSGGSGGGGPGARVDVSGVAALNPIATAYYNATGGTAPSVVGLGIMVVDPMKSILGSPDAVLATGTIGTGGTFSFTDVDFSGIGPGVVITIDDAPGSADTFARSTIGICEGAACTASGSLTATALAVPNEFVAALEGATELELLSGTEGFVLGMALQSAGTGLAPLDGVTINTSPVVNYLKPDLTIADGATATTAMGAFVVEPPGGGAMTTLTPAKADTTFVPAAATVGQTANVVFQVVFVGQTTTP